MSSATTDLVGPPTGSTGADDQGTATPGAPLPSVPEPTAGPPSTLPAMLVAVVLLGLGAVLVNDALVTLGWVSGTAVSRPVLEALATGVDRSVVVVVAGVVLGLLGLWLLRRALARAPRTEVSLGEGTHAWVAPADLTRVATLVASDVDGVVSARARGGRRAVAVRVTAVDAAAPTVQGVVRGAVEEALAGLDPAPRVSVRVSTLGGSR